MQPIPTTAFPVWRKLRLGTPDWRTADGCRAAFQTTGRKFSGWANMLLGQPGFTVVEQEIEVDLVNASVEELGFPRGGVRADIYARALTPDIGLALCPPELGPRLRLDYTDQAKDECLIIGMEPLIAEDGNPSVWTVEQGLWLQTARGDDDLFWHAGYRWVFCRASK